MDPELLNALRKAQLKLEDPQNYDLKKAEKFLKLIDKVPPLETRLRTPLEELLKNPPEEDTSLIVIYDTGLVRGEIVAAGKKTLRQFPLTQKQPIHFRKTLMGAAHADGERTKEELEKSLKLWAQLDEEGGARIPMPLGAHGSTFRSELIMGKALLTLTPIHWEESLEPKQKDSFLKELRAVTQPKTPNEKNDIKTHWKRLESIHQTTEQLHKLGWLHLDCHRQNMLVENGTNQGFLIDFETSEPSEKFAGPNATPAEREAWEKAKNSDLYYLIVEGYITMQGLQPPPPSPFGKLCAKMGPLIAPPYIRQAIQTLKKEANSPQIA
jgi:hypothetical protein